ncbi:non-homologous end-joining DNA ligase [Streptomyces avicenniae]|uniref:non-homologous end-joining DNA ligase n=1 Tax=Streptomyces avicenniae TaxID=500153 RepID=UPI00167E5EE0|nr:non-homologous end-joining DNA ligase [Streptomyces avicenniae]
MAAGIPQAVPPILAVEGEPPTGPWAYEYKWDGYRCCLAVSADGKARLTSRNGNDFTPAYPEVAGGAAEALDGRAAVLDGELVALGAGGRPDFGQLQRRTRRNPGARLLAEIPVTFFAFDLLRLASRDLTGAPWTERRAALEALGLDGRGAFAVPPAYTGDDADPARLVEVARGNGLEGIVAKRLDSPYLPGKRSRLWVKKPLFVTREVIVGGWQPGEGHRAGRIGSLLLGAYDEEGALRYIGHVGTGFSDAALSGLADRLEPLARGGSPFDEPVPRDRARKARWTAPEVVGEVTHRTWTRDGRLRHAAWRGLRPDRTPAEIVLGSPPLPPRER